VAEMLPEFVQKKDSQQKWLAQMVWCSDFKFLLMIASLQQVVKGKRTLTIVLFSNF
jgi:hypothetical protein